MPTQEERLSTLEKTVALLQKSSSTSIQELNRNVTMLLGIASSQQLDIKEIKISQITAEDRLDAMNVRIESGFETLEKRLGAVEKRLETVEGRFEAQEKKFDQVLSLLTRLVSRLERES